jgi:hypothetical protein
MYLFLRRFNHQLPIYVLNVHYQTNVSMILVLVQLISMMMTYKNSMMNTIIYDVSMILVQRNVFMILVQKRSVQMNNVNK